jgi:Domain of unknown function (DUF397)
MDTATLIEPSDLRWQKARASVGAGACVQFATVGHMIALRDSKYPDLLPLFFDRAEVSAFLDGAKNGEFDSLIGSEPRVLDRKTVKALVLLLAGFASGMANWIITLFGAASFLGATVACTVTLSLALVLLARRWFRLQSLTKNALTGVSQT